MKKILPIAIAAMVLFSLDSCQQIEFAENNNESVKTERIISGAFTNDGTKTTLYTNGKTPLWSVGDVVRVLDGTTYQDVTLIANGSKPGTNEGVISADSRSFTFATTLTGTLYAVYPASATTMTKCTDGNITFTVPAIQDGTFASANICIASGDGANSIYFRNATAVVEMTVASGVVYANLTAANKIAGDMTVTMGASGTISSTATDSLSSQYIFVSSTPSESKFYMAVAPVTTGAATITCNTSTKSGSIDKGTKTLAMDKIYAMNLSGMTIATEDLTGQHGVLNGQEYVLIKAKYDGTNDTYLKWATQNLAVTESGKAKWNGTNYIIGDYFQFAASYEGYGITADADKIPANLVIYNSFVNTTTSKGNSFSYKDSRRFSMTKYPPYHDGTQCTKYVNDSDYLKTIDLIDDVANLVLHGTWRLPTSGQKMSEIIGVYLQLGEFSGLVNATTWTWDANDKGYYVTKNGESLASDKSNALLFFPAAGEGEGAFKAKNEKAGEYGYYWASTINPYYEGGYNLNFSTYGVYPAGYYERSPGFSVRPVSD